MEREVETEERAPDRLGHVELRRQARLLVLTPRVGEERSGVAERAEVEAPRRRRRLPRIDEQPVGDEPPEEEADVLDRVPAVEGRDRRHVDGVARLVERAVHTLVALVRADVEPARLRPEVLEVLRPPEQLEELDGVGRPAGDVPRELLEHGQRALAAAVVDRLRHVGARADGDRRPQVGPRQVGEQLVGRRRAAAAVEEEVVRDEVADVRDHPVAARLDEEVAPELRDVGLDEVELVADELRQAAQREAVLGVLLAVDRGQQLVQPLCALRRHHAAPVATTVTSRAASSTTASSAGSTTPGARDPAVPGRGARAAAAGRA